MSRRVKKRADHEQEMAASQQAWEAIAEAGTPESHRPLHEIAGELVDAFGSPEAAAAAVTAARAAVAHVARTDAAHDGDSGQAEPSGGADGPRIVEPATTRSELLGEAAVDATTAIERAVGTLARRYAFAGMPAPFVHPSPDGTIEVKSQPMLIGLTADELAQAALEAAYAVEMRRLVADVRKAMSREIGRLSTAIDERIEELSTMVRVGKREVSIPCASVADSRSQTVRTVRLDTLAQIGERAMSGAERQRVMFDEPRAREEASRGRSKPDLGEELAEDDDFPGEP